jgi:opacity protein-like surface antigen
MSRRALGILLGLCLASAAMADEIEHLVPTMEGQSFRIEEGARPFVRRLSFTPAFGQLGGDEYYSLRLAFNPNPWLGYEAHLGHNPSESVHALMHSIHALLRYPFSGRFQPYASVGYGMMMIFPGAIFKADPVTKNAVSAGAGLEIYIRNDVALRTEVRGITLMGGTESAQAGSFDYRELSVGLAFYRSLGQ